MSSTQMEALDFRYLLLEYYKKLRISENELSVLLMVDHYLGQKNTLITPDLLSMKMNLSIRELDQIFVNLIERGFLLFDTEKSMKVSLKPLRAKLLVIFEEELAKENETNSDEDKKNDLENLHKMFEKELKRKLSPLEISLINEWVEKGFSTEMIESAFKECLSKGKKTLRSIDKLLLQWKASDDFEKVGFSVISDKWDKDIEKTMEIAKAKWIDD